MWIFLPDAMLSIVQKKDDVDTLTVRARIKGDIEAVFPGAEVTEGGGTDYRFRAKVSRAVVAKTIAERVMSLNFSNFKATVKDRSRHDAYLGVWDVMSSYQDRQQRME